MFFECHAPRFAHPAKTGAGSYGGLRRALNASGARGCKRKALRSFRTSTAEPRR